MADQSPPTVVVMPRLSDSMEEGTVVRWLVPVGAPVARGQVLVEIDTDKATMDYEADTAGTLLEILLAEGETAPIGAPIARIGTSGARAADEPPSPVPVRSGRVNASPVARRLAGELGLDLASLKGTGPAGQITKDDVEHAARSSSPAPAPAGAEPAPTKGDVRLVEPTRVQQVIARRMAEGSAVPTFAVEMEIDVTAAGLLRRELGQGHDSAPSLNDVVVKAAAKALRDFPQVNGSYTEQGFELYSRINIGIAVAAEDTLVVPVIVDADIKPLSAIAAESRDLAAKVRNGSVSAADLAGGTFTISNLGMFGVSRFTPIVNPPQAAILGLGNAAKRPLFPDEGGVVARDVMTATLVCDHRIVYGADAARFLARLRELLERPMELLEP